MSANLDKVIKDINDIDIEVCELQRRVNELELLVKEKPSASRCTTFGRKVSNEKTKRGANNGRGR